MLSEKVWEPLYRLAAGRAIVALAAAFVLAEAVVRFIYGVSFYLVLPFFLKLLQSHTNFVASKLDFEYRIEMLAGSIVEFILAMTAAYCLSRWAHHDEPQTREEEQK